MPNIVIPEVLSLRQAETARRQEAVIVDSPHSGDVFPEDFRTDVPESSLRRVQDSFVDDLFADSPGVGASLLVARFPRSYVDPNRAETDIDPRTIQGKWPRKTAPTEKSRLGHGLIWRTCPAERAMYSGRLSQAVVENRIENYWRPYHAALKREIDRLHALHGVVFHIDCHSMPSGSSPVVSRDNGVRRADFVLGDRDGKTCVGQFSLFVRNWLENAGYRVRMNDPYKGAELISRYSDPLANRHSLQIEINRALYMEEASLRKTAGFGKLKNDMTALVGDIAAFARGYALPAAAE